MDNLDKADMADMVEADIQESNIQEDIVYHLECSHNYNYYYYCY